MFFGRYVSKKIRYVYITYEYYPLPQKGQYVYGLEEMGKYLVKAKFFG